MKALEFEHVDMDFVNKNTVLKVLDDISFSVDVGEILAITGPSGAGKSTILNLIAKLLKPTNGKIIVNGDIGYMFQKDHLFEWKSIYRNVLLGLEIQKNITDENIKEVNRMLEVYGLADFRNNHPKELSGGMRQRVALIRTLAVKPDILLLDEPFASLDYQTKLNVSEDIYNIIRSEKKTTIIVSHDISEAIAFADRVMILSSRPASIKEIVKIKIDAPTPIKKRQVKVFQNYFEHIWGVLNSE